MYQQPFFGPQQPLIGGSYGPRPMPHCTQPVTAEMSKMLLQNNDVLDIRISNVDKIRNWCTHKEPGTGRNALYGNPDGTVTCRVCGTTFNPMSNEVVGKMAEDGKIKTVKDCVGVVVDALETVKSIYLDAPEEFIKNYSPTITMAKKVPDLLDRAEKNWAVYEGYFGNMMPGNAGMNPIQAMGNMLNMNSMPFPQYSQGYYMQQPGYPQQGGYPQQPQQQYPPQAYSYPGQQAQAAFYPQAGAWPQQQMPPQGAAYPNPGTAPQTAVPMVDPYGNVVPAPQQPAAPTTMYGQQPVPAGYNPFMSAPAPAPGAMGVPQPAAPQQPAAPAPAQAVDGINMAEPTQTKQMTV